MSGSGTWGAPAVTCTARSGVTGVYSGCTYRVGTGRFYRVFRSFRSFLGILLVLLAFLLFLSQAHPEAQLFSDFSTLLSLPDTLPQFLVFRTPFLLFLAVRPLL